LNIDAKRMRADETIDLREAAARVWSKRWWILVSVLVCCFPIAAAVFLMTPVYRATSVMVPAGAGPQDLSGALNGALGPLGGLASLAGINVGPNGGETVEALAVLTSREFTEAFVRDRQLMPKLFRRKWDPSANTWKPGVTPPTPARAYKYFDKRIRSVLLDKKTGLVTIQIDWRDPLEAAAWNNELVQRLNTEMRARAIDKANASLSYLEKELSRTNQVPTRDAINRLVEAQVKQRMLANVTQEFAFRVVDKALPPDRDDPIMPQTALWLSGGVALGLVIGVARALLIQ
jgi:uncharacterized protein involved in exopolysaccharide biosynthesis